MNFVIGILLYWYQEMCIKWIFFQGYWSVLSSLSLWCHYMMLLLLSSGGAWMPSHMEGWFYTLPGGKTVPQDGYIRWRPVPVFCVWPAAPTQPSPGLPSGAVWWCNMQWAALCSGGFSYNETYNKYVTCLVPDTAAAVKS